MVFRTSAEAVSFCADLKSKPRALSLSCTCWLQILQAALEQAVKRPGQAQPSASGSASDASSITGDMREVALRAEQARS